MALNSENLLRMRGTFFDTDGHRIAQPEPGDQPFLILAGEWPNANIGARQTRCDCCKEFVGISPKGWSYHLISPVLRPILCLACFTGLSLMLEKEVKPNEHGKR